MGYNFRPVERDQQYLMPPSVSDWLPEDDLAWLVLDAIDQIDLGAFRARYRADGWGAAAYDPAMMVALLLYAYAQGERSSRRIEARCRRDIGYRVVCANQAPDHATIARFRADHETALGDLFGRILRLCAAAGLERVGLVALDGTRMAADAALAKNRTGDLLDAEIATILAEAAATDAAEDAAVGAERRGDELPEGLTDRHSRLERLREARRQIDADAAARDELYRAQVAARDALPRPERAKVRPPERPARRQGLGNPTDPDSRPLRSKAGWVRGYSAQAAVSEDGLILAAELSQSGSDVPLLAPLLEALLGNVAAAAFRSPVRTVLADGGYWSETSVAGLPELPELLIPPTVGRPTPRPSRYPMPRRAAMLERLATDEGRALYRRRCGIVEPVFGQLKEGRGCRRFRRRGLSACASEWRLMCATHNLLKLWRSGRPPSRPSGNPARQAPGVAAHPGRPDAIH